MENSKGFWDDADVISTYTDEEAEEDGILVNISKPGSRINFATTNLLQRCGYLDDKDEVKEACIHDLLLQCHEIMKRGKADDWFYSGKVETPDGDRQKVFIQMNGSTRFTVMLPEDY